jgi:predicted membrane channel-forming protein YqfA (hemolysin III family)
VAGNIYVHLLPALALVLALLARTMQPWPLARLQYYENILAILLCLCGSVIYHTFMANHTNYRHWLLIDVRLCQLPATCF